MARCSSACCAAAAAIAAVSAFCAVAVAVMVATVSAFCARRARGTPGASSRSAGTHARWVRGNHAAWVCGRYSTGPGAKPAVRSTRDDGGKNNLSCNLSCFGFWKVWCRATGRGGLRTARNLV
ncbi:hypothetical protein EDB85DRAFT_2276741 [Lactarius pseudohatsudake]|nr:hypothetical protein EDB85DRAFT_2276741 [Lactarius pseudohatsudake]